MKISQYPAATSPADADKTVIVQGGVTKSVLLSALKSFFGSGAAPTPTAANDFQVAEGSPLAWTKKTLNEVKALVGTSGTSLPAAGAENDVIMAGGSPLDWIKVTWAGFVALVKGDSDIASAITNSHAAGSDNQDLSGKADKVATSPDPTGKVAIFDASGNLAASTKAASDIHASGSDNQDLSGKMDVITPTAESDFLAAAGSPLAWVKKTVAEVKTILGIEKATMEAMLLDKDVAIAAGDNLGNVQIPVPRDMVGKNLSADSRVIISPLGTASTSGAVTFSIVRHRPSASPVAADMTLASPILSIAQDGKTSGSPSIDTANDDLAAGDFISLSCESAGTGAKGPLWLRVVAE